MYRVILWGMGIDYNTHLNLIKYMESAGKIKVVAITATEVPNLQYIDGYRVVEKQSIKNNEFEYIVVMNSKYFLDIRNELIGLGVKTEKIISSRFMDIPYVDIDTYIELKNSKLSIISNNCWGGIISHTLGLEHLSPFKNLFLKDGDYIKLLMNMDYYLECEPSLARMNRDVHTNVEYPVLLLDDVELHCNHETDAQNAISTWNRRCKKVNLDNLFVEMYTLDRNIAEKFCQLEKYEKKVCFVPFKANKKEMVYLPMLPGQKEFYETVNSSAGNGKNGYIYILTQLLEGKIVSRVD